MKAGLLTVATLFAVANAQPHVKHQHLHGKREVETDYDTVIDYVTATAPAVYVYVDQYGNTINAPAPAQTTAEAPKVNLAQTAVTTTQAAAVPTTTEQAPAYTPPVESPTAVVPVSIPAVSVPVVSVPAVSVPAVPVSSAAASTGSSSSGSGSGLDINGLGLSYSPYKGTDPSHTACKTAGDVANDFEQLSSYSIIRLYGSDCSQVENVNAVLQPHQKLFLGVFDVTNYATELSSIKQQLNGNWSAVDTISIGNEYVNGGGQVQTVTSAVAGARDVLKGYGYTGSVVTVDTFTAILANPALCQASDYVAANCHAFFDGNVLADGAGKFVLSQAQALATLCNKNVVITESGWPSQGDQNGKAVASEAAQQSAINSLSSTFSNNLVLFSAYNDFWKANTAYTFGAENFWGIHGNSTSSY